MGNQLSSGMKKNMDDNRVEMMVAQRMIALKQRETMMAFELARAKDRFQFYLGFYFTVLCVATAGALRLRNPAPVLAAGTPTTWALLFQYDLVYGNKLTRVSEEADRLLREESGRFALPPSSLLLDSPEEYDVILRLRKNRNEVLSSRSV